MLDRGFDPGGAPFMGVVRQSGDVVVAEHVAPVEFAEPADGLQGVLDAGIDVCGGQIDEGVGPSPQELLERQPLPEPLLGSGACHGPDRRGFRPARSASPDG